VFRNASTVGVGGIVLAIGITFFIRETGHKARPTASVAKASS
jgi:hypothetical protein